MPPPDERRAAMRAQPRWSILLVVVGLLAASQSARSDEDKAAAPPLERKAVDEIVNRTLRDVINRGAAMYNDQGDYAGCYRLWEGALLMVRPFLDHRPELQKAIDAGIVDAQRNPQLNRRAFVLREVIDKIRTETRGPKAPGSGIPAPGKTTLWERLGGEKNVARVVDDLVAA